MNDCAAHLVDHVLPLQPIRQWVCSLPFELRTPLGYDRKLYADVINAFVSEVMRFYRFRAKHTLGLTSVSLAHPGAVTLVQRFDSALRSNVHAHTLALDGVYVLDAHGEQLEFHPLPSLSHEDVLSVAARTAARIRQVLRAHGRLSEPGDPGDEAVETDDFAVEQPVLLSFYHASARGRDLLSERAGRPTLRLLDPKAAAHRANAGVGTGKDTGAHAAPAEAASGSTRPATSSVRLSGSNQSRLSGWAARIRADHPSDRRTRRTAAPVTHCVSPGPLTPAASGRPLLPGRGSVPRSTAPSAALF